jgi:ATP-dependent helicase STH1/SNF2
MKTFQHSVLEADQDEIIEEDGDMNDVKLNELIPRLKSGVVISHEMDIRRDKDALESWRARDKRGNSSAPLCSLRSCPSAIRLTNISI